MNLKRQLLSSVVTQDSCTLNLQGIKSMPTNSIVPYQNNFYSSPGNILISKSGEILDENYKNWEVKAFNTEFINTHKINLNLEIANKGATQNSINKVSIPMYVKFLTDGSAVCISDEIKKLSATCESTGGEIDLVTKKCNLYSLGDGDKSTQQCEGIDGIILRNKEDNKLYCSRGSKLFKPKEILSTSSNIQRDSVIEKEYKEASQETASTNNDQKEEVTTWIRKKVTITTTLTDNHLEQEIVTQTSTKSSESGTFANEKTARVVKRRERKASDIFIPETSEKEEITKRTKLVEKKADSRPLPGETNTIEKIVTTTTTLHDEITTKTIGYY